MTATKHLEEAPANWDEEEITVDQLRPDFISVPEDEYCAEIVCEEYQKGFKMGDTLIRAAMVAVAA